MIDKHINAHDLDRLEALARAATAGPWMRLFGERTVYDRMSDGCRGNAIVRADVAFNSTDVANLDFIAAANPAVILQLIAKIPATNNDAERDVLAERRRQVEAEGYDPQHDDAHPNEEIAAYAALYAMPPAAREWPAIETGYGDTFGAALRPVDWYPKFGDRRRELVKAAALLLAEIERLDRAKARQDSKA